MNSLASFTQTQVDWMVAAEMGFLADEYEERQKEGLERGAWYAHEYYEMLGKNLGDESLAPEGMRGRDGFYTLTGELQPSQVLDRLDGGRVCFIDCSMAYQIALYRTIQKIWGDVFFDGYFQREGERPFALACRIDYTPLCNFQEILLLSGVEGKRKIEVGDWCGFKNHREYLELHPDGACGSYNVVCVDATPGNQRFIGWGLPKKGVTEEELMQIFANEFNQPSPGRDQKISVKEVKRGGGGLVNQLGRAKLSIDKIIEIFFSLND